MTNKAISIFNQLRPLSVGFDDVFDHFESMFDGPTLSIGSNYPPYNIVKTGDNKFNVEVALAGFNKKDINISVENGLLTIESVKDKDTKEVEDNDGVLFKVVVKVIISSNLADFLKFIFRSITGLIIPFSSIFL